MILNSELYLNFIRGGAARLKDPDFSKFRDFVMTETRFSQLPRVNPANAEELLTKSENYAKARLERIKKFGL